MKVYTFVDSRDVDRYDSLQIFLEKEDAEAQRNSMGNDAHFFDVNEFEVIK